MTVMEKIRNSTDSTAMRAVVVMIVLVFVFWGVGTGAGMQTTQAVALVNGERITDTELQRQMRNQVRGASSSMDEDEIAAISKQVLEQLIADEVLVQRAEKLGLEVSTEEMQRYVLEIDAFKDDEGTFSAELYGRALKRMGMTKGRFEEQMRSDMMRNKLREVVVSGVTVSDAEVRDFYDRTATQAELTYVRINDKALAEEIEVSEARIDELLATGADRVTAAYEADKARLYSEPRKIRFHRILLRKEVGGVGGTELQAKMDEIRQQAVDGADFADLARRWSEDLSAEVGGDAGLVAEPLIAPQLASAALAAGAGSISQVVETDQGLVLLKVDKVVEAIETPLDDVKRDIAREIIAKDDAAELGASRATELLAAWKDSGSLPVELLQQYGLLADVSQPFSPTDSFVPGLGVAPGVAQAVSDLGGKGVLDAVFPVEGGRVIAAVSSWSGADEAQYAQIESLVRMQLLQEKQGQVLEQWMNDLVLQSKVERLLAN